MSALLRERDLLAAGDVLAKLVDDIRAVIVSEHPKHVAREVSRLIESEQGRAATNGWIDARKAQP